MQLFFREKLGIFRKKKFRMLEANGILIELQKTPIGDMRVKMCVCVCVCMRVNMCVSVCMSVCVCLCV